MFTLKRAIGASVALTVAATLGTAGPARAQLAEDRPRTTATFNATVRDIAYAGSVIYVAGNFTKARDASGEHDRRHVAAIDADTGQVLDWNPGADAPVLALAVTKSSVVLGGEFDSIQSKTRHGLALVSRETGQVQKKLRPNLNKPVRSLAFAHGRLYVGGEFTRVGTKQRRRLAAFDKDTFRITPWRPQASGAVDVVQPAGRNIFVGGSFAKLNGKATAGFVAAVRKNGAVVRGFNPTIGYRTFDILVTKRRVYVGTGGPGGHLYAVRRDGSRKWARTFDGDVQALASLGGVLYVGGHFEEMCSTSRTGNNGACRDYGTTRGKLAAFSRKGVLNGWSPDADSVLGVMTMERSPRDRLGVGGTFVTFADGSIRNPCFAEFDLT